jgi:D-alanine-D-alanine ligase
LNIVLFVGGFSSERVVSLTSGKGLIKALRDSGHSVKVIDPIYGIENVSEEIIFKDKISEKYPDKAELSKLRDKFYRNVITLIDSDIFNDVDIVFIGLHGKFAEDGRIQTLLETRGVKYTGAGIFASAKAMDKDVTKAILRYNGIITPDWFTLKRNHGYCDTEMNIKIETTTGFPVVVKATDEGSTVGLSIVKEPDKKAVADAINKAFDYTDKIILEKYIKGRELTVPIIGNKAYPIVEIVPKSGIYDYENKYSGGKTDYYCPADLNEDTTLRLQDIAIKVHNALECEVYSRVDFILSEDGIPFCLEINTLPGFTELSLVPKSAKAAGMSYNELVEKIIELSLNKYR